jgi:hypothetical protein
MRSSKFPVKRLIQLNFGAAVVSFSMVFTILFLLQEAFSFRYLFLYSFFVFVFLALKGFINLGVLLYLEKRLDIHSSRFSKWRYSLSLLLNAFLDSLVFISFAIINERLLNVVFLLNIGILILIINAVIIVLQDYLILWHFKLQSDMEYSRLKTAQAEAANQLLRQQIHPHFLFNALNTLKSLYKIDTKAGDEYLVRLSDFLRASVSNNDLKTTPLKDEIKLCVDYLEMQKIRFGASLCYSISIPGERLETGYVPSFAIQTLLENAIKHNGLTPQSPLNITIQCEADKIKVTNNLQYKATTEASTGSGLVNLAERYRMISKDELIIENDGTTFSVSINILEHGDSHHRG